MANTELTRAIIRIQDDFNYGKHIDFSYVFPSIGSLHSMGFSLESILEGIVIYGMNAVDGTIKKQDYAQDEDVLGFLMNDLKTRIEIRSQMRESFQRYLKTYSEIEPLIQKIQDARSSYYKELKKRIQLENEQNSVISGKSAARYLEYRAFLKGLTACGELSDLKVKELHEFRKLCNISESDHKIAIEELGISEKVYANMIDLGNGKLDKNTCRVCWNEERSHVCLECFFLVICANCHDNKKTSKCPTCRKTRGFSKIFM
jgi:rubrerythrin